MFRLIEPTAQTPFAILFAEPGAELAAVDADAIAGLYRSHGALLFRGFAPSLTAFEQFASSWCSSSVFNESPDRKLLDADNNIQSVNGGADAFPLHPELAREPWKPDVCFFLCFEPPQRGGQTTVCDGVAIVEALDPEVRAALSEERLVYEQRASLDQLEYWLGTSLPSDAQLASPPASCPYSFHRVEGEVVRQFSRPALHRPMFDERPAFGNFLLFANDYLKRKGFPSLTDGRPVPDAWLDAIRTAAAAHTREVGWQAGDLLMIDNSRFMHGRTAITDPERRLIATYFGYLKFAPPSPEEPRDAPWRVASFIPPAQGRIAA